MKKRRSKRVRKRARQHVTHQLVKAHPDVAVELLWRAVASLILVILISIGVKVINLHPRDELFALVPRWVLILFVNAMTLLASKAGLLFAALRRGVSNDRVVARRLFLADQISGAFVLAVVCLELAFLYAVPAKVESSLLGAFAGLRETWAATLAHLGTYIISGIVGNAAYGFLTKWVVPRVMKMWPNTRMQPTAQKTRGAK
ncbi:MAG TPA: hypothetical protein VGQ46_06790 [Thermoanaerobaculia bacterium]|jgi:predicted nuclease with RNAse H fold|nr:hypothetical protein [Thermoanaerobaculia bacterium]